ncbi:MAG: DUF4859 domain-containing protein [Bacteroidaceae bacterium]|nr:DUF4859 domain-containing protein [Bacteroidaceae bacterium]
MKKIYFSLLVLAMTLVSTVAKAQFEGTIEMFPATGYDTKSLQFSLSEVATALETDTATLRQAIDNWTNQYTPVGVTDITNLIDEYLNGAEGVSVETITNLIDEYLNGNNAGKAILYIGVNRAGGETPNLYTANGFGSSWMDMNGDVCSWGDSIEVDSQKVAIARVYNDFAIDPTNDIFEFQLGQYPNRLVAGDLWTGTFTMVYGEKEVTFTVRLQIVERPAVETLLSQLEIVSQYDLPLEFTVGKSYEGKTYSVNIDDVYATLGTTPEELDADVASYTYTQVVQADSVEGELVYSWSDVLQKPEEAAGGAWFGRYINYNEATGEETVFGNAPKTWNTGGNTFYTQSITLNNGEFSIVSGQFPDVLKVGDSDYADLYIINGNKACQIHVYVVVKEPEVIDPNAMIQVGDTTIAVTAEVDNNYATKGFTIDMEAVVAALGCTTDDLEDVYAWASEGSISDNHTESSGGFYYNDEGYIENWGSNASFFIARTTTSLNDGKFTIGQMANHFADLEGNQTVKGDLIFQYEKNYYVVTVEYTVKGKEPKPEEFTYNLVATETLSMQIIPGSAWAWETKSTLDLEYIASKIGTEDFKLYTDKANSDGELSWSSTYTCTPAPGFWYGTTTYENEEHQVVVDNAGWGTNSFGITYAGGEITWYQYPGQRQVGDSYTANIYLANEETGDYIKYILYVRYVEEVTPEAEFAGQEEVTVQMTNDLYDEDEDSYVVALDMQAAYDSLGISEELVEACSVIAPKSSTVFDTYPTEEQIFYNAEGYTVSDEDASAVLAVAVVINEEGAPVLLIDDMGFFDNDEATAIVRIGLEYDGKRYLHIITLTNVPANE